MPEPSIYQFASATMKTIVARLVELASVSHEFNSPDEAIWQDEEATQLLLCGKGIHISAIPPVSARRAVWLSRAAIDYDLENAATQLLYQELARFTDDMITCAFQQTNGLQDVTPEWICQNPQFLPIIMHATGTFSKQQLKKIVGNVSDKRVSKPAAARIVDLLRSSAATLASEVQVAERLKATVEGIVRDLVGRMLLETFVGSGLDRAGVPYRRERDYAALQGVVYDFRADFVIPNENEPKAFIEVRKSSERHASLYAKDKMFSAINWKGRHADCLGILVVHGPWTAASLHILTKVFDYVVPVSKVPEVAQLVRQYLEGDTSVLRWLITFRIDPHH